MTCSMPHVRPVLRLSYVKLSIGFATLLSLSGSLAAYASEERMENKWVVDYQDEESVWASVNGKVTHGDRLRLRLHKSDCSSAQAITTVLSHINVEDQLQDGYLLNGAFMENRADFEILFTTPFFDQGSLTWVELGRGDVDAFLGLLTSQSDISFRILDGDDYKSTEHFTVPLNRWATEGLIQAVDEAKEICSQL